MSISAKSRRLASSGADARLFDGVIAISWRLLVTDRSWWRLMIPTLPTSPSLRLLLALARQVSGSHLLVVGTCRDDEVVAPRLLSDIGRLGHLMSLSRSASTR